ncbi:L-rhamnose mutarotase [Mucilaginibacter hurinus]|uniref:L-rhamnose mutarotase n=1 Tax=Mucilaginibacter hurinus TaxID=2201324 RepID=A0A367GME8_9SPHI|nr:L-rhamnose mutarotase [Mucilaginibacter hurinus]RCH53873.1 L-rhamnose mutarotase [Mucilaginibacter hurinus]
MERIAFKMKLHEGCAAEYKKRHDEIWPELPRFIKDAGVHDYSIFLDEDTNTLIGVLKADNPALIAEFGKSDLMQRWWRYMSDIMASNPDGSTVVMPLKEVFYLK